MSSSWAEIILNEDRDFETDNLPSSGPHEPIKANLRLGTIDLDATVSAITSGLLNNRGVATPAGSSGASGFPTTGGSGSGGAIKEYDAWFIKSDGYVATVAVNAGDLIWAGVDAPGQTVANWYVVNSSAAGGAIAAFANRLDAVESSVEGKASETELAAETTERETGDADTLTSAKGYTDAETTRAEGVEATKADKTTTISGAGLVTGGGSLAANRAVTVTPSISADVFAGTDTSTAMTPASADPRFAESGILPALDPDYAVPFQIGGNVVGGFDYAGRLDVDLANPEIVPALDQNYAIPFSVGGLKVGGIDYAGRLDADLANPELTPALDPNYAAPVIVNGQAAGGWQRDGRLDADLASPSFAIYTTGSEGSRSLKAWNEVRGEIDLATGEFDDVFGPVNGNGMAYYFGRMTGGAPQRRECNLNPRVSFSAGVTTLTGLIVYGQSLAEGFNAQDVVSGTPLDAGRAGMFNGGVRVVGGVQTDATEALDPRHIDNVVDLHEGIDDYAGETVCTQAAHAYLASVGSDHGILCTCPAVGGQTYEALEKGTVPFANLAACALRMVQVARLTGRTMPRIVVFWRQGESNQGDSLATYEAKLVALQNDLDDLIRRVTGQAVEVIVITDQISVFSDIEVAGGPTQAQFSVAIDHPTQFCCIGPKYRFTYTDGLHINALSQGWSGAYLGRALTSILVSGGIPKPLYAASYVRTGASIVVTFAGNLGNLAIDTSAISNPGGTTPDGFMWRDGSNSATVTGVSVTASNQITVTLSNAPTGSNGRLLIGGYSAVGGSNGGPTTGPRTCLRDSSTDTVTINGTTYPLYNWACHQVLPVA